MQFQYCYSLFTLFLALFVPDTGLSETVQQRQFNCRLDSKTCNITFYQDETEYEDVKKKCKHFKSILLHANMHTNMKDCIMENLKNIDRNTSMWLDSDQNGGALVFNLAGVISVMETTYGKHSFLCINQEFVFKIFSVTVESKSFSQLREYNLLLPPWSNEREFNHVSEGEIVTLTCEADGIPVPQLQFKKNGIHMSTTNSTQLIINKSADTCGGLGTFTCQDWWTIKNKSISITVPCNDGNASLVDDHILINCSVEGLSYKDIKVIKLDHGMPMHTYESNSEVFVKIKKSCDSIGTYICVISLKNSSTRNTTSTIGINNCSAKLCPGEDKSKSIDLNIDRTSFSFCVVAFPRLAEYLLFNNTQVFRKTDNNFDWDFEQSSNFSSYIITVTIKNTSKVSHGELTIRVSTSQGKEFQLNYTVITGNKDGSKNQIHPTTVSSKSNQMDLVIPVALATVAIVVAIFCIICVVCGVFLYKKRKNIIRTLGKMDSKNDNIPRTTDSVELQSTVNVCTNIKHNRSNSLDRNLLESRSFIDSERAHSDSGQELYSTVNTVNVYTNMRSIVQAASLDTQNEFYQETSLTDKHSNGQLACGHSADSCSSCKAKQNSGRYISDGLLYITLEQAGKSTARKPVKSKFEDNVEYIKLDFDKTEKLNKKKQKLLSAKRSRNT